MHIWTEFSPVGIYYFSFDGFRGLFWSINAIFSVVNLLDFYDAVLELSSIALTNLSIELPCVMGFKFPCDPLVLEAKLETLCLGASRHGNPLRCSCLENLRDWGALQAAVYGVAQSLTWLKWLSSSSRSFLIVSLGFSVYSTTSSVNTILFLFFQFGFL